MRTGYLVDGRYELEDACGSGSGGVVWAAFDRKLKRRVALKRSHAAADGIDRAQFRREAETAAQVQHPNAISIFDAVDGDGCWLVMEYLPAESLDRTLAKTGPLPPERVARIGVQIAGALAAVHAENIVHRDVKPGNILVAEDGLAKLTDFGISIWRAVTRSDDGRVSGTPAYVSPEVANGYPASRASDVFALGATLFAAVEGTPPFGRGEPNEVLRRVRRGEVLPMRQAGPLVPLLEEMLRPQPGKRPTAEEIRARLENLIGDWESPVSRIERPPRVPFWRRSLLQAAVVALVAILGTAVALGQEEPPEGKPQASAGDPVGDERTADPCALLDLGPLRQFGPARLVATYGNFNRCDALVDVRARAQLDIEVQLITRASRAVQGGGPLEVVEEAQSNGECDRTVVVDDVYAVRVSAKLANPPLDLCAVADVATGTVVEVLRNGPIPRRAHPFPTGSLAYLDACTLLDDQALTTLAAVDSGAAVNVFGNWACKWFSTVGGPGINLRYDQHPAQELLGGELVDLGGHAGYVQLDTNKSCTVSIPFRPPDQPQRAHIDVVVLTVRGDQPALGYCPQAKSLAAVAAGKLPS